MSNLMLSSLFGTSYFHKCETPGKTSASIHGAEGGKNWLAFWGGQGYSALQAVNNILLVVRLLSQRRGFVQQPYPFGHRSSLAK